MLGQVVGELTHGCARACGPDRGTSFDVARAAQLIICQCSRRGKELEPALDLGRGRRRDATAKMAARRGCFARGRRLEVGERAKAWACWYGNLIGKAQRGDVIHCSGGAGTTRRTTPPTTPAGPPQSHASTYCCAPRILRQRSAAPACLPRYCIRKHGGTSPRAKKLRCPSESSRLVIFVCPPHAQVSPAGSATRPL